MHHLLTTIIFLQKPANHPRPIENYIIYDNNFFFVKYLTECHIVDDNQIFCKKLKINLILFRACRPFPGSQLASRKKPGLINEGTGKLTMKTARMRLINEDT